MVYKNLMFMYEVVNHGEETIVTEVRVNPDNGLATIIRRTGYKYNGKIYKSEKHGNVIELVEVK